MILFSLWQICAGFARKSFIKGIERKSNPSHNPALLCARMNLEPVAAVDTSLDAGYYLLRISLLPMLTFRADNYEFHVIIL